MGNDNIKRELTKDEQEYIKSIQNALEIIILEDSDQTMVLDSKSNKSSIKITIKKKMRVRQSRG